MDGCNSLFQCMDPAVDRVDIALYALVLILVIQFVGSLVFKIVGKVYPPVPFIELICRPFIIFFCDRLNRAGRSDFALIIRGLMVFFITLVIVTCVLKAIYYFVGTTGFAVYADLLLLLLILSPVSALWPMIAISYPNTKDGNYRAIARLLNINLVTTDDHGLRRMAGKASVYVLPYYIIGPILWFILTGIPGLILYLSSTLFVRITATKSTQFKSLAGLIDNVMQWPVNILTTLFVILGACFSAGGRPLKAMKGLANGGLKIEAALAYSQNLILGGPYQTRTGETVKDPWIGGENETAKLSEKDVLRVVIQHGITVFMVLIVLFAYYTIL